MTYICVATSVAANGKMSAAQWIGASNVKDSCTMQICEERGAGAGMTEMKME